MTCLIRELEDAFKQEKAKEFFIKNVDRCSADYMRAIELLLGYATSEILVFIDRLDQTLADGTLLYSNPEILNLIIRFLKKSTGGVVTVVVRHALTSSILQKQPLFVEVSSLRGFQLFWAQSERVRRCYSKIIIVDRKAYSFRVHKYAWINCNDPGYATKLSLPIKKAIRLPDTCQFDNVSISFLPDEWAGP